MSRLVKTKAIFLISKRSIVLSSPQNEIVKYLGKHEIRKNIKIMLMSVCEAPSGSRLA